MKYTFKLHYWLGAALMACAVAIHAPVSAQQKVAPAPDTSKYKVLIGTGSAGNTYDTMSKELMRMCAQGDTFGTQNTGGTLENINNILSNKQDAGWGQEDSLFLKKATNPEVNQLKTLITLHPEEVHVFVKKVTGLFEKKSTLGIERKGDPIVFTTAEQLAGYTVAAWGGSFDTARLIAANSGINFAVIQVRNQEEAFAKLAAGQVQAVLAVAGAPSEAFEKIPQGAYKLVGFGEQSITKLVSIYNGGATLNYMNLESEGIKTISTNASLFTREYSDPEMLSALSAFRACALAAAPKLKDLRGSHKKWKQVNVTNKGKWQWYDLPAASVAQTSAPAVAPKRK